MLQQENPDDYVIGTGEKHSVREFIKETAKCLGMDLKSNGEEGVNEKYIDEKGNVVIEINPLYFRPSEVDLLFSNPSKAKNVLGWEPKIRFKELVKKMVDADLTLAEKEAQINQRIKTF